MTLTRRARYALLLSRREFADFLGVSVRTIESWEQGRRTPPAVATPLFLLLAAEPGPCKRTLASLGVEIDSGADDDAAADDDLPLASR